MKQERLELLASNTKFTKRLSLSIGALCRAMPIKDVAKRMNLDWHTVKELEKDLNCALKPRHNESVTWPFSEATCQIIGCGYFRRRSRKTSSDVWSLGRLWRRFRRNWGLPGSCCINGVGRGVAMARPV